MVEQGDLISFEGVKFPAIVVSNNRYNASGKAIVCPVVFENPGISLQEQVEYNNKICYVCCDAPKWLDIGFRGPIVKGHVNLAKQMQIIDKIQSIFDYI